MKWAVPRIERGIETASPKIQESLNWAAHELSETVARVSPMIQESLERVGPRLSAAIDEATPRVQKAVDRATPALNEALEKATPALSHARNVVLNDYLPAANEKIGQAAEFTTRRLERARVPEALHQVSEKLTPSPETVERVQNSASAAVGHVSKELNKVQKPAKKKKGWLVVAVIAAAGAAAVAAWRASKPIDDPWKTPAPVEPTTVRASGPVEVPASVEEVRDEVAASAAATKENRSAQANEALADNKEQLSESAEEISEAATNAKHKAEASLDSSEARVAEAEASDGDTPPKPGPRTKK